MEDLEKLAVIINNANKATNRKLDELSDGFRNQKPPVINVSPPQINVADVIVPPINMPEIVMPPFPPYPAFPEIKIPAPIVNIPKQEAPIVNVPAPIVNVPPANITVEPKIDFPKEIEIKGMKELLKNTGKEQEKLNLFENISSKSPLPIMVIDKTGKQVSDFGGELTAPSMVSLKVGTTPVSSANPLPVSATVNVGDIEIGAVEIKNSTDDTRATVDIYGLATKATIKDTAPTDITKNNPSEVLGYDEAGNLTTITDTINGTSYQQTLSYDASGNLINISAWTAI
jgi:hypothetical protein